MTSAIAARQSDDPLNIHVANALDETAQLLEEQRANAPATRFARRNRQSPAARAPIARPTEPSVAELLDIDREYRESSDAGTLPRIAPRRFNPTHAKWLPILHATRDGTHYTALFSNTARAHDRGTTHDWVVIYFEQHGVERQRTVVTAKSGLLEGRRVVRGRELECARHYHVAIA